MSDLIKREDAIKAIDDNFSNIPIEQTTEILKVRRAIRELPPADIDMSGYSDRLWKSAYERGKSDRSQGEWQDTGKDPSHSHPLTAIWYECSVCGDGTNTKTNYCPNCGCRMRGDKNDQ